MVQVPAVTSETVDPVTVHAADEVLNVTALADPPPVALTVKSGSVAILLERAEKAMVCAPLATSTKTVLRGAALCFASPAWSAATSQVPAAFALRLSPETLHGPESTEYATASVESAAAVRVTKPPTEKPSGCGK